jgi:rhomboid protease GluP
MTSGLTYYHGEDEPHKEKQNQSPISPNGELPSPPKISMRFAAEKVKVTYFIVGLTVAIFILQTLSKFIYGIDIPAIIGAKSNQNILAGEVWRLVTPMFLHGNITHIFFNMYALISLGRNLEMYYGHFRFVLLYLVGGFAGNIFSFLNTSANSYGASTAVFGLIAAQAVFIYQNRRYFKNPRNMLVNIMAIIGINLFIGQVIPVIDQFGHLGGLLGGLAFAWLAGPVWQPKTTINEIIIEDSRKEKSAILPAVGIGLLFAAGAFAKFFFQN